MLKDSQSHREGTGAVITRSFFVSTAFNLNRSHLLPPFSLYSAPSICTFHRAQQKARLLYLSLETILVSFSLVRRSSYSVPRVPNPKPVALSDWPRFILQRRHVITEIPVMDVPPMDERVDVIICSFYDRVIRHIQFQTGLSSSANSASLFGQLHHPLDAT